MLGYGLGLRTKHYNHILENKPKIDWFEIISENYMVEGGRPRRILRQVRKDYPIVMHGVALSIGSTDSLNLDYLKKLKELVNEVEPQWISDHLCWGTLGGHNAHDLLPLPYTEGTLQHLCERLDEVQNFLKRPLVLENVSTYVTFKQSSMPEWEFLKLLHQKSGCRFLLDINNIYVSHRNHGFDSQVFVNEIPQAAVIQFHLAGHTDEGDHVIDTHDEDVRDEVWDLYQYACKKFGPVPTMIERDGNIPEFEAVFNELQKAKEIQEKVLSEKRRTEKPPRSFLEAPPQP